MTSFSSYKRTVRAPQSLDEHHHNGHAGHGKSCLNNVNLLAKSLMRHHEMFMFPVMSTSLVSIILLLLHSGEIPPVS